MLESLSKFYGYLVERRNRSFDSGSLAIKKVSCPVISVGNISTGGTGKTPFVIMLAEKLIELGYDPAVAGRGYARRKKQLSIISDGKDIYGNVDDAGDEMYMLAKKLNIPVAVNDSKHKAAKILDGGFQPSCIIIDDGFQHRWLHRDLDIVLLDSRTLEKPKLMPSGRLREPVSSLERAGIIAMIGDIKDTRIIENYTQNALIIRADIAYSRVSDLITGKKYDEQGLSEAKKSALACSGIANHEKFHRSLQENGWNISGNISFPDHYRYSKKDVIKIRNKCQKHNTNNLIITEKDAVKLIEFKELFIEYELNCYVFSIEMIIIENKEEFFRKIVSVINNK
jgi:tetraacyldisaccharide 4'-kinase